MVAVSDNHGSGRGGLTIENVASKYENVEANSGGGTVRRKGRKRQEKMDKCSIKTVQNSASSVSLAAQSWQTSAPISHVAMRNGKCDAKSFAK